MKKIEEMTEEEVETIIKLASELTDLLQPYMDAFLDATEALANILDEIQKQTSSN